MEKKKIFKVYYSVDMFSPSELGDDYDTDGGFIEFDDLEDGLKVLQRRINQYRTNGTYIIGINLSTIRYGEEN